MQMHQIRYFLAVSDTLNWTKAADRCNVAQPSLTRAIKALEAELGGELLRRERALTHLTELGQRVLPMLRQCYETAVSAKMAAESIIKGDAVPLSLAISHTVSLKPFAPMLQELARVFPGLRLKLQRGSRGEVADYLKSGTVEMAIAGPLGEAWTRLDVFPLFEEHCDLAVAPTHRLAAKDGAEFKDLAAETLVIDVGCEVVDDIRARLRAHRIVDPPTHDVGTREDQLALLSANLGVAVITVGAAETHALRLVPLKQLDLHLTVSVYTVAGRQRGTACATLLNMLRAAEWASA